jgi:hypothetical protein
MAQARTYNLPRGCTAYQAEAIKRNSSGLLGRFGISGLPQNTWLCHTKDFEHVESEWVQRGVDDRGDSLWRPPSPLFLTRRFTLLHAAAQCKSAAAAGCCGTERKSEAALGSLHTFSTHYNKGSAQQHSDFKATVCQRVYTTFKLRKPDTDWWLDISCGGGSRQMVAAACGLKALGLDLRRDCVEECVAIARRLCQRGTFPVGGRTEFREGDMRDVEQTIARFVREEQQPHEQEEAAQEEAEPAVVRFGGMFTSIPFWTLEKYDAAGAMPQLLEHCRTFQAFVTELTISLRATVRVLDDQGGAWICVHCGAMRDKGGRTCDIPYEVKRILRDIEGVEVLDEVSRK